MSTTELHQVGETTSYTVNKDSNRTKYFVVGGVLLAAAVGIGLGILIGYLINTCQEGPCLGAGVPSKIIEDADPTIQAKLFQRIDANNIKENLRKWTQYPHIGGSEGSERVARDIHQTWQEQGLDHVTTVQYDVLLSYPQKDDPSVVEIIEDDGNGTVNLIFQSQLEEAILRPEQNHSDVVPPFNAYSPPRTLQGRLVYVNYGRVEDFNLLADNYSIDFNDTIVIARYGRIFRGDKVKQATRFGAKGIILYTDPADYSVGGVSSVYPDSWWLPPTGVQRGTIFTGDGDPITPGYPSIDSAYRWSEDEVDLPQIPSHPISYGDAEHFLKLLAGPVAEESWQGGLNITYNIGPGFIDNNMKVRMHITTRNQRANATNVFGYINGSVEPDRYVLLGNHRDAWVFGAVDPTSGTAAMMEISRVFGDLVKEGWRPRRTIIFCSWGSEEYGLTGSYEWVENYIKPLTMRSVVYLNVDLIYDGNYSMDASGVPILYDVLYRIAKEIETPNGVSKTMYEEWLESYPALGPDGQPLGVPTIWGLGSGSDYAAFLIIAGIPALDVRFSHQYSISSYPLYHSVYETFHLVENFIDRHFEYGRAIAKFWAEAARLFSDSLVLPFNVTAYAVNVEGYVVDLERGYGAMMNGHNISLEMMNSTAKDFTAAAIDFHRRVDNVNRNNPLEVRGYNDRMMGVERAFLDPAGLPTRPLYKHLLFAPSQHDSYSGATFPGLVDLLFEIDKSENPTEQWEQVKRHLATLIFVIKSATYVITE